MNHIFWPKLYNTVHCITNSKHSEQKNNSISSQSKLLITCLNPQRNTTIHMTSISDETISDTTDVGNALASLFEEPPPPPQTIRGFGKALQFHYGEPDLAGGQGEILFYCKH